MYKDVQFCTKNQIQIVMAKIHKHLTLEKRTVEIIKKIAAKEKRNQNSVVDRLVQEYAAKEKMVVG